MQGRRKESIVDHEIEFAVLHCRGVLEKFHQHLRHVFSRAAAGQLNLSFGDFELRARQRSLKHYLVLSGHLDVVSGVVLLHFIF